MIVVGVRVGKGMNGTENMLVCSDVPDEWERQQ